MLSNRTLDKISLTCYATVSHLFANFQNPEFRGPNFKWDNFPEIAKGHCETQVYCANIGTKKTQQECLEHARDTGEKIALNLIKWAGIKE